MTSLSRSKNGKTVHEPGCRTRGEKIPWLWADGKTLKEIAQTLIDARIDHEVVPCKVCLFDVSWNYAVSGDFGFLMIEPTR